MWINLTTESGELIQRWWIEPEECDRDELRSLIADKLPVWDSKEEAAEALDL